MPIFKTSYVWHLFRGFTLWNSLDKTLEIFIWIVCDAYFGKVCLKLILGKDTLISVIKGHLENFLQVAPLAYVQFLHELSRHVCREFKLEVSFFASLSDARNWVNTKVNVLVELSVRLVSKALNHITDKRTDISILQPVSGPVEFVDSDTTYEDWAGCAVDYGISSAKA